MLTLVSCAHFLSWQIMYGDSPFFLSWKKPLSREKRMHQFSWINVVYWNQSSFYSILKSQNVTVAAKRIPWKLIANATMSRNLQRKTFSNYPMNMLVYLLILLFIVESAFACIQSEIKIEILLTNGSLFIVFMLLGSANAMFESFGKVERKRPCKVASFVHQ